eukprot:scaffold162277_cov16-Tisochrysis_lutea.AAC.1
MSVNRTCACTSLLVHAHPSNLLLEAAQRGTNISYNEVSRQLGGQWADVVAPFLQVPFDKLTIGFDLQPGLLLRGGWCCFALRPACVDRHKSDIACMGEMLVPASRFKCRSLTLVSLWHYS